MADRGREGNPPAAQKVIQGLKEFDIEEEKHCKKNEDGSFEYPRCSICIEDLTKKAVELPCKHVFNMECIKPWLA